MANVNSVNGNSNSAAVEQAAELNKQNAEKTAELNKQNAEKAAEAASKTDTVKISTAAQSASSSSSNANTNSGSNANANASSNSNDNEDSTSLSKKRRSGRHSRSNSSRYSSNNSSRYDRSSRSDKAERSSKADSKGLRISSSRNDRKVEHSGRHTSSTEKVNNRDRTSGSKRGGRFDASMLKAKTEKLSNAFKGLSKMGVSSKEVSKIMKSANRSMNEKLGNDLKQAYSDYKDKKISGDEFKSKLYESAIKKVQGIASSLMSSFMQKPASGANNSGSTTPSFAKKEDGQSSLSFAKKADNNGSTTPSFAAKANDNGSSTMSFAKKDDAQTSSAPRTSIFDKKESATSTPTPLEKSMAKKDEPSLAEKAMAANKEKMEEAKAAAGKDGLSIVDKATAKNKEKSEGAKAAAKTDEKTAMEAKPAISQDAKITEKKGNIAKDVGDHLHTTTEKSVENSALKTGKTNPGEKGPGAGGPGKAKDGDDDKKVAEGPKPTPPGLEKKEEGAIPPGLAKNEGPEAVPPGQAKKDDDAAADISKMEKELKKLLDDIIKKAEKLPPGLAKKDEVPGNADKVFEEIIGMFNEMDKMVNGLDKEVDGAEEDKGFGDFVSGLKGMFNSGNGVEGNSFLKNLNKVSDEHGASAAHKVGMETIKAETLSGLLKGGSTNSAFGVNSVGDNGDGSGNYSAVNFMSDMSNNSSEGLDSYKDAKEAREESGIEQARQAKTEAQLSEVA